MQGKPEITETTHREKNLSTVFKKNAWIIGVAIVLIILLSLIIFSKTSKSEEKTTDTSSFATSKEEYIQGNLDIMQKQEEEELPPLKIEPKPEPKEEPKVEQKVEVTQPPMPAPMPAPNPYMSGNNGKKELTLEERILQSSLMADGGKSEVYQDKKEQTQKQQTTYYEGELREELKAVETPSVRAKKIDKKEHHYILSKGTFIACILKTRMDTTVPGMTSCVIPQNVYSMNGRTLLIEKGSTIIGEYRGAVQNGLDRIFVLWTQIRTPEGIIVDLNSPASDQIGGAGMGGQVNHHWFRRFGSALLFSVVSDGFQYVVNRANSTNTNGGDITYENTQSGIDEIIKEAMAQSGNIPPTLIKNQGERVGVMVARDVDFSSVYDLKNPFLHYYQ